MALNNYDVEAIQVAIEMIPEFDGYNMSVHEFLMECDESILMINADLEQLFVKFIRTKLKGDAFRSILGKRFLNYQEIKIYLLDIFRSCETINHLIGKISYDFQNDNEKVISFATRVKNLKRQILNIALCEGILSSDFQSYIDEILIDCFIKGLKPEIEIKLKKNSQTFEEVILEAVRIEKCPIVGRSVQHNSRSIDSGPSEQNETYQRDLETLCQSDFKVVQQPKDVCVFEVNNFEESKIILENPNSEQTLCQSDFKVVQQPKDVCVFEVNNFEESKIILENPNSEQTLCQSDFKVVQQPKDVCVFEVNNFEESKRILKNSNSERIQVINISKNNNFKNQENKNKKFCFHRKSTKIPFDFHYKQSSNNSKDKPFLQVNWKLIDFYSQLNPVLKLMSENFCVY